MQIKARMGFDHTVVRMGTIENQMITRITEVGELKGGAHTHW